jgi:prolipoprotein diacylglyceryltransferase
LPLCVAVVNLLPLRIHLDLLTCLAAGMVSYTIGEGLGRLACISFGCCYGKPVEMMPAQLRPFLSKVSFVFRGETKKIAYASGLANVPVIPVQAFSVIVLTLSGVLGLDLFLHSQIQQAFFLTLMVSQLWRISSEFLRYDFRGGGRISAYQIMSALVVAGGVCVAFLLLRNAPTPIDVGVGVKSLFSTPIILALQFLWLSIFIYMGKSTVTGSNLRIFVRPETSLSA